MPRKNRFFSIGDISKFTGASIKSLRYYEEVKILEPAFIDPDSNYRYYSYDQVYLINIIQFCIELDIPLKNLTNYIGENETIDLATLLAHGKELAEKKLKKLLQGLQFIEDAEQQIALADKHHKNQKIYSREILEKLFYIVPLEHSLKNADAFELSRLFTDMGYNEDAPYELIEFGYMCEHSPSGVQRYAFVELSKDSGKKNTKIIPAGTWLCRQGEKSQIEQASQIFNTHLKGKDSFLAIETEIYIGKYKISRPTHELRIIALH